MIMLIILFVVASIFTFVLYYMRRDVSSDNFKLLKVLFLGLIIFMLSSYGLVIFIRWEGIGVISIILIGYWIRPMAKSGAISAIMYNRWGDLIFLTFMFICREIIVLLLLFAVMCKSSLYLYQYWLPVAIEGPTPVSSLLHSSTIVVAGVYLMIMIPVNVQIVIVVLILGINIMGHVDVKKNIAYSTSIHLVVMLLLSLGGYFSYVVAYIILHGMIKRQLFQSSGYEIHRVRSQDMRKFNMSRSSILIVFAIIILSAMIGMVIIRSKEVVVLGVIGVLILLLVVLSIMYTIIYLNKSSVVAKIGESEGNYVLLLILRSIMVVDVNFRVWVSLLIFGLVLMIFYRNSISTVV